VVQVAGNAPEEFDEKERPHVSRAVARIFWPQKPASIETATVARCNVPPLPTVASKFGARY
jgi:hypothetical protein